ncbi:nucleoside-diphosphate-sugar epimerase [Salinarchaeum sp. Harcht-Bsk1]|uniref:NAD-dependent epimerase/dehydratase family protein n=1 Tax=Salinarchaeum sp. Harcht-Bsk1 TaxID=1333523 RepID=UPI00034245F3|nr:NAD-dependent epimerase/dehydratase family protein [Salinarchaeum sp. Harcht-Bsk1]AGN02218.1 nucleoside-diphosphate-sugar epimerase [Salinarchaeum sp. Harcht-Bsk1]
MTDDPGRPDGGSVELDPAPEPDDAAAVVADVTGEPIRVPDLGSVLVTGGGGFIGSHLVDALARHNDVRVLDRFDAGSEAGLPETVTTIEGDVRDRELLSEVVTDVDVIVHLAAQVSVEDSLDDPQRSSETNVAATLDVLELARREDARVVLASSAAIYGDPASIPIHETDPKRPESPYGVDKLAADNYARVYDARFDVPVVVLRYFNVYGADANAGVIRAFMERVDAGESLVIHGDGEQTRDFVHVDDVVRATIAAATTPHTGRAYNVGTGERVSIAELAHRVVDAVDDDLPIEYAPPRDGDVDHSLAAIDRARSWLGFEPRVDLETGIEATLSTAHEHH